MKRLLFVVTIAACGPGVKGGPTMNNRIGAQEYKAPTSSVVSEDILAREPVANTANVRHILISWNDLGDAFGGRQDPRAAKRTVKEAEAEVKSLLGQLKAGGNFEALMKAHSEDSGSAATGQAFTVTPDAQLVIEFRQLALRLNPGEIGVCQSEFGFHIIKRYD
ncbi:MAG: peptidylprolyl isomerase [Kofleriaceae bacterium]|nr:peptidylprolyl isomerase [Kofleriaceae bacterium]